MREDLEDINIKFVQSMKKKKKLTLLNRNY